MKKYSSLMKFSLLSISLILTSSAAVSGTIPDLAKQFPDQSEVLIELVTMLPTIFLALFVLISIPVSRKIGDKKTVLIGLLLALVGGLAPAFLNNFWLILFFRALLGAGLGLYNAVTFELLRDFFTGEERVKMIGYQSSFQGLGGAALTFIAGQLLVFGWHAPFWVYVIALPILALFFFFVPELPRQTHKSEKLEFNKAILIYAFVNLIVTILYNAIAVKLPDLFVDTHIGSATDASNLYSLCQIATMVTGFVYLYIFKALHANTLPAAILLMAAGLAVIVFGPNIWVAAIGAILMGIAFAMQVPYLFNKAADISTPSQNLLSSTVLIMAGQGAGFFAPFVLTFLGNFVIFKDAVASSFVWSAILLAIIAILVFIVQKQKKGAL